MSLNGLEATEVIEAYQSALGEGGGWFVDDSACQNTDDKLTSLRTGSYSNISVEMKWACLEEEVEALGRSRKPSMPMKSRHRFTASSNIVGGR